MLYFSLFTAGIFVGVFVALYVFRPQEKEDSLDPQHFYAMSKPHKLPEWQTQKTSFIAMNAKEKHSPKASFI